MKSTQQIPFIDPALKDGKWNWADRPGVQDETMSKAIPAGLYQDMLFDAIGLQAAFSMPWLQECRGMR